VGPRPLALPLVTRRLVTPEVRATVDERPDIVGLYPDVRPESAADGLTLLKRTNRVELDRAAHALEMAAAGHRVVVVSSGDPGVFAMGLCPVSRRWRKVEGL